jgi:hypothetical protein
MGRIRRQFWLESALALGCGALAAFTVVRRDWIEALTGLDPDGRSGSVEWLIVAALTACCVVAGRAALRELHHAALV